MPENSEWYRDPGGPRLCRYCGTMWTMTHACASRQRYQVQINEDAMRIFRGTTQGTRQERRQGRSARRRKLEILEAERESLIVVARAFRNALVLISNARGWVDAVTIARRVLEATPAPEESDVSVPREG